MNTGMQQIWQSVVAFFDNVLNQLQYLFTTIKFGDFLDILIVAFIAYELIVLVRNTRAAQLVKGIGLMLAAYAVALLLDMRTVTYLLNAIMSFGIVVLAVIFQPELRRAFEQVGGVNSALSHLLRPRAMEDGLRAQWQKAIAAVCDAAERLAEDKVGALIVLERRTNLVEIVHTGTAMNSEVNVEILGTIFYEGTPLHDGAVVISDARIKAAGCFLPLSNNMEISKDMGTRHRAALGMSENSDAVVVVVSEETGIISLAKSGVLIRRMDRQNLFNLLVSEIIPPEPAQEKKGLWARLRRKKPKEAADAGQEKE